MTGRALIKANSHIRYKLAFRIVCTEFTGINNSLARVAFYQHFIMAFFALNVANKRKFTALFGCAKMERQRLAQPNNAINCPFNLFGFNFPQLAAGLFIIRNFTTELNASYINCSIQKGTIISYALLTVFIFFIFTIFPFVCT